MTRSVLPARCFGWTARAWLVALGMVTLASPRASAQEDLLVVHYIPWWGNCDRFFPAEPDSRNPSWSMQGAHPINRLEDTRYESPGWSKLNRKIRRNPDLNANGIDDGLEFGPSSYFGFNVSDPSWLNLQLSAMREAGVKVVSIEWGSDNYVGGCIYRHIQDLVNYIDTHPEFGLKFFIFYNPAMSQLPSQFPGKSVASNWCDGSAGVAAKDQFRMDMRFIAENFFGKQSYFKPIHGGQERPVVYLYQARDLVNLPGTNAVSCQNGIREWLYYTKVQADPAQRRIYYIADLPWQTRTEFGSASYVFDAIANFGEAGVYGDGTNPCVVQYSSLTDYTNRMTSFLRGASASSITNYTSRTVDWDAYRTAFVAGMSLQNNNSSSEYPSSYGCLRSHRSIVGTPGTYENQFRYQMERNGWQHIRTGAGNFPFGMAMVSTWNGYNEGTTIEPANGEIRRDTDGPAPCGVGGGWQFPPTVDAATKDRDYCYGNFFVHHFKKFWNLAFWLPTPYSATMPTIDASGRQITLVYNNQVTLTTDTYPYPGTPYAYTFPNVSGSTAYLQFRGSPRLTGYTAPEVTGFPTKLTVEATIRRANPMTQYQGIVSNRQYYDGWQLMIGSGNQIAFHYTTPDGVIRGADGGCVDPRAPITDTQWHKVAAVLKGTTLIFYKDDVEVCRAEGLPNLPLSNNTHDLIIGNFWPGDNKGFVGSIREVKVYVGRAVPE